MSSLDIAGINWSAGRLLPAFQTPKHLTIYDLRGASKEVQLSAATMRPFQNGGKLNAWLRRVSPAADRTARCSSFSKQAVCPRSGMVS